MKKYCFALDLKNDAALIEEYEYHHRRIWPQIDASIRDAGIRSLEIYRIENRLFMIMEAEDYFSLEAKAAADAANPVVQEWEQLMWQYQQALPTALPGQKWLPLTKIFDLNQQL